MAATYTPIASITLGTAVPSITFSSIPATYTDLVMIVQAKTNTNVDSPLLRLNGDTGTNYSYNFLSGNGSSGSGGAGSNTTFIGLQANATTSTSNFNYMAIVHLMNYANTTTNKSCLVRDGNASVAVDMLVGLWRNTAAITSITVVNNSSNNFSVDSTFNLYGILGANA
jgi:hypothetical protein